MPDLNQIFKSMGPHELILKLIQLLQTSAQWRLWTLKYYCEPWATPMLLLVSTCVFFGKNSVLLGFVKLMFSIGAQLHEPQILSFVSILFLAINPKIRLAIVFC